MTLMNKSTVHFLHIRKTGGTAIKEALKNVADAENFNLVLHPHNVRLQDIPQGEKIFFFLRDPVSRFVSGFNSRLREGKPRYHFPWNEGEKKAFSRFPSANDLAEALSAAPPIKNWAERAMAEIRHINVSYAYWLESIEYVKTRLDDLLFVGFQETLDEDFEELKRILRLPNSDSLPQDEIKAHRTPEGYHTDLSDEAIAVANIRKWYAQEFKFIDFFKTTLMKKLYHNRKNGSILAT